MASRSGPRAHNPFFDGPSSDLLAMIPFIALSVMLYLVGRDVLAGREGETHAKLEAVVHLRFDMRQGAGAFPMPCQNIAQPWLNGFSFESRVVCDYAQVCECSRYGR